MDESHEHSLTLTPRESAVVKALRIAITSRTTPVPARQEIVWALGAWKRGRPAGAGLIVRAEDADARLFVVRLGLLARLSRLAPVEAPPLGALLRVGDETPRGWVRAIDAALAAATAERRLRPAPGPAAAWHRALSAPSAGEALRRFIGDKRAFATDLDRIDVPAMPGQILLGWPEGRVPDAARAEPVPRRCTIRYSDGAGLCSEPYDLDSDDWRALNALVAGLYAVDRLALTPERAAFARGHLRWAIAAVIAPATPDRNVRLRGRRAVVELVTELDDYRATTPWRVPSQDWTWPSAFALVVGAIDRFAGAGAAPLARPVAVGTWVELPDPARSGVFVGGTVHEPVGRDGTIAVKVDGVVQRPPLKKVRTGRRAQLFGYM